MACGLTLRDQQLRLAQLDLSVIEGIGCPNGCVCHSPIKPTRGLRRFPKHGWPQLDEIGLGKGKGLGARRIDLICHRVDTRAQAVRVGTATPVRDVKRLTRLLCDKIETIEPGFGIELMSITATVAEPIEASQTISSLADDTPPDVSDLVDILTNRVGDRALFRAAPVESDVPERSVKRIAPMSPDNGATWTSDWPGPARLFSQPEPIETVALLPDHPPVSFTWRGVRRRVRRADGPNGFMANGGRETQR